MDNFSRYTRHYHSSVQWCAATQWLNGIHFKSFNSEDPLTSYPAASVPLFDPLSLCRTHYLQPLPPGYTFKKTKTKKADSCNLFKPEANCMDAPARFHPLPLPGATAGIIFSDAAPLCANQPPTSLRTQCFCVVQLARCHFNEISSAL